MLLEKRRIEIVWLFRLARSLVRRLLMRLVEGLVWWLVRSLAEREGHRRSCRLVEDDWRDKEIVNRGL